MTTEPNRRRGGDLRAMLTPTAVGATSGFMGLAIVEPGDRIAEHYHPYSEEFVYVVSGELEVDLDGEPHPLRPDQGLMIPAHVRHRFRNVGSTRGPDGLPPRPAGPAPGTRPRRHRGRPPRSRAATGGAGRVVTRRVAVTGIGRRRAGRGGRARPSGTC